MSAKGCVMVCMAAFSGVSTGGCLGSNALPPTVSSGRPVISSAPQTLPVPNVPPILSTPQPSIGNPWQPTADIRDWRHIVIHHTASTGGSVESIDRAHRDRKDKAGNNWLGIGYHFVIGNGNGMEDGEIATTFRWQQQMHGAHAGDSEYNQHGIGIVLVGNFQDGPPSTAQLVAVKRLVRVLKSEYGISADKVVGHREVKATACPGKYFPLAEVANSEQGTFFTNYSHGSDYIGLTSLQGSRN